MIVDMHRHLWSMFERYAGTKAAESGARALRQNGGDVGEMDIESRAAQIRSEMAAAGVDRSVLLLADYGLRLGEPDLSIEAENRLAMDIAREDPDSFIAFYGIDPRRVGAAESFRRAIDEGGARGLKLHPCAGFYPDDPVCRPLYKLAGDRGIPVAVHTGPLGSSLLSKPANPVYLDEPAADFPETNFIILHAGQAAWFPIALEMARWKPNLYLELAMWQIQLVENPEQFVKRIGQMRQAVGLSRVLFGSDCPGLSGVMSLDKWVQVFRDLPETAERYGVEITPAEVDLMLGGNAATLLQLS